jgi:MYXO-CTERM domain-containing protein
MNRLSFVSFAVLFAVPAMAQEITESVADVSFEAEQALFRGNTDNGFRFPADSAFAIVINADIQADAEGHLDAISHMTWPEALTQTWEGVPGGGELFVDAALTLAVEATLDGEVDLGFTTFDFSGNPIVYGIWSDTTTWSGSKFFDSLLLPGSPMASTSIEINDSAGSAAALQWDPGLEYVLDIPEIAGFDYRIEFDGTFEVRPDAVFTITGVDVTTLGRSVATHDAEIIVPAPSTNDGTAEYESVWKGEASSRFDLIAGFFPNIRLVNDSDDSISGFSSTINGLLGSYTALTVPVGTDARDFRSKNTAYTHDLPAIDTNQSSLDFGSILVDTESQLNLTVEDLGAIELWGDISIEGDGFSISRPDLEVDPEGEVMVTVTFRPGATGNFDGTLTLESNDPVNPVVAIPLSGNGFDETGDTGENNDTGDGPDGSAGIRGCGCSSAPGGSLAWLALIPAFGFVLRRRR